MKDKELTILSQTVMVNVTIEELESRLEMQLLSMPVQPDSCIGKDACVGKCSFTGCCDGGGSCAGRSGE
jgi:hypothetical protein